MPRKGTRVVKYKDRMKISRSILPVTNDLHRLTAINLDFGLTIAISGTNYPGN